jgi:integrase
MELRKNRDGRFLRYFYGRIKDQNGKSTVVNCGEWRGKPPASGSLNDKGDAKFEASRTEAKANLKASAEVMRRKGRADHLTERLIESKTGRAVEYVRLADLADRWRTVPRETKPGADWLAWCDTVFNRFAEAVQCTFLHEVTPEQAAAYIEGLREGYTRRTVKGAATMLQGAFARLLPPGATNPFVGAINRKGEDTEGDTIHRRPFTADELARLFEAARADDFLFPLVVTAACTGLRRGDVCGLPWKSVDLRAGVVAVKTAKTGASVEIPIFAPLREVFEAALADRATGATFVFPEAARMVKANPDGLTWRFKKLVASIMVEPPEDVPETDTKTTGRAGLVEHLAEIETAVAGGMEGAKRDRVLDTLRRYAAGQSVRDIEKATGWARSTVSTDLHGTEALSGIRFMATGAAGEGVKSRVARLTRSENASGRARRASILDWHALRVTWVTLALSAGVPMEVCRLVTGHKTVEIVLRHYFKPGREHLRAVLGDKLPSVLTGNGCPTPPALPAGDKLGAFLAELTPAERKRLVAMLTK